MANASESLSEGEKREAIRALPWVFVSLLGVAAGLTIVFLVMRVAMEMGGSCASGGPYVSARPCPDVMWLMPVGIVGGLFFALIYVLKKPARAPSFTSFAWPALFLSLGWNFLEFGLQPPGRTGLDWGWLICAILFALMGGAPLAAMLLAEPRVYLRRVFWGVTEPLISAPAPDPASQPAAPAARPSPVPASPRPPSKAAPPREPPKADDVVTSLERLSRLHQSGSLTDAEFEAAKQRVLAGGKRI